MKRTLTALTVAVSLMASGASAFGTTDQIKLVLPSPVYTVEETEEEILIDRKSILYVEENGILSLPL